MCSYTHAEVSQPSQPGLRGPALEVSKPLEVLLSCKCQIPSGHTASSLWDHLKVTCWIRNGNIYIYKSESCSVVSDSLWPHGLSPWNSPGQNTGVGSLFLLQGIFPTQGSNPGLPHCRRILYWLSHKGSPRILEWVAFSFSRGSSQPRDWTQVSHIAGGFFTGWITREAQEYWSG